MKKTISTILVCVLLIGAIFSLASCELAGFVVGTYAKTTSVLGIETTVTYEFSGKEVTVTTVTKLGSTSTSNERTGEYEIGENDEGQKTITISVIDDNGKGTITTYTFNSGKDDNGAYIELNGTRYDQVKN